MLTIRPADTTDLPAILSIYNDAILNTTAVWISQPVDLNNREAWLIDRQKSGFPVLVAVINSQISGQVSGQIAGYASYGAFRAFEGYRHTAELSVYVSEHARGQGVASALMQALIDHAKSNDIHVLLGAIEAQNTASLHLHQKHGFTQTGLLPQVGRKFDRWLDLVLMQRVL